MLSRGRTKTCCPHMMEPEKLRLILLLYPFPKKGIITFWATQKNNSLKMYIFCILSSKYKCTYNIHIIYISYTKSVYMSIWLLSTIILGCRAKNEKKPQKENYSIYPIEDVRQRDSNCTKHSSK